MNLKLEDVKKEDRGILAPCGILCAGCDTHLGEGMEAAKKLYEIWNGSNMEDIGPLFGYRGISETLKTIEKFIKTESKQKCPGCFMGGGPSKICGIAQCVKSKGYWTCAECEDYDPNSETPCPHVNPSPMPMSDKGTMMEMICRRYNRDNINNLKQCREMGYNKFIKQAKEKIAKGWRTWQIISKEKVFTEAMNQK
jgi:hypothetical protein